MSTCTVENCSKDAIKDGKCMVHAFCYAKGCQNYSIRDGKCREHLNSLCTTPACDMVAIKIGGKCKFHSIREKRCVIPGCILEMRSTGDKCASHESDHCSTLKCVEEAVRNGKCNKHIDKNKIIICDIPGCDIVALKGGKQCKVHSTIQCSYEGCESAALKGCDKCASHLVCVVINEFDIEEDDDSHNKKLGRNNNKNSNSNSNSNANSNSNIGKVASRSKSQEIEDGKKPVPNPALENVVRCNVVNCNRPIASNKEKCNFHSINCSVAGCSNHQFKNFICYYHYTRPCNLPGCKQVAITEDGLCETHGVLRCSEIIASSPINIRCNQLVICGDKCKDHFVAKCNVSGCIRDAHKENTDGKCIEHSNPLCIVPGCGREKGRTSLLSNGSNRCPYHDEILCGIVGCNSDAINGTKRCYVHSNSLCSFPGCYSEATQDGKCDKHYTPPEINVCHILNCRREAYRNRKCRFHLNSLCNVYECTTAKRKGDRCTSHYNRLCRYENLAGEMCSRNAQTNGYCEDHDLRPKCVHPGCKEYASKDANLCQTHIVISIKPEPEKANAKSKSSATPKNKSDQKNKTTKVVPKRNEKDYTLYLLGAIVVVISVALLGDRKYAIPLAIVGVLLSVLLLLTL